MSLPLPVNPNRSIGPLDVYTPRVRALVDEGLDGIVGSVPAELGPVRHATARALGVGAKAGRRWRPLLTVAVCESLGGRAEDAIPPAIALEITHTASLVLDDMPCMDDSPLRRGEPATHASLGSAGAILTAIGLLARAAELLGGVGTAGGDLAARWGETFGFQGMSGGQVVDLTLGGASTGSLRRLYRKKTTALVELAVEAGAVVADVPPHVRAELRAFGNDVGWAYQLVDDAQDLAEDQALGRAPGGRNPLYQAQRLLDRGVRRMRRVDGFVPGGAELLESLARDVVRIPPLSSVSPPSGGTSC